MFESEATARDWIGSRLSGRAPTSLRTGSSNNRGFLRVVQGGAAPVAPVPALPAPPVALMAAAGGLVADADRQLDLFSWPAPKREPVQLELFEAGTGCGRIYVSRMLLRIARGLLFAVLGSIAGGLAGLLVGRLVTYLILIAIKLDHTTMNTGMLIVLIAAVVPAACPVAGGIIGAIGGFVKGVADD